MVTVTSHCFENALCIVMCYKKLPKGDTFVLEMSLKSEGTWFFFNRRDLIEILCLVICSLDVDLCYGSIKWTYKYADFSNDEVSSNCFGY